VPKDDAKAFRQYSIAAELGSVEAMNSMGRLYEEGRGVAADLKLAVRWYERAIAEGDRYAPADSASSTGTGRGSVPIRSGRSGCSNSQPIEGSSPPTPTSRRCTNRVMDPQRPRTGILLLQVGNIQRRSEGCERGEQIGSIFAH
jgi:TPR repeat protein